jgi:hypothetical protein
MATPLGVMGTDTPTGHDPEEGQLPEAVRGSEKQRAAVSVHGSGSLARFHFWDKPNAIERSQAAPRSLCPLIQAFTCGCALVLTLCARVR